MGKILVKQANVQQFQAIGGDGGTSIGDLGRTLFAPRATGEVGTKKVTAGQRAGAGLGLLGKLGAMAATGMQTANSLQGGNISAPFSAPLNYQGIDPTSATNRRAMGLSDAPNLEGQTYQGPMMNPGPTDVSAAQNPSPNIANIPNPGYSNTGKPNIPLPTTPTPAPTTPTPPATQVAPPAPAAPAPAPTATPGITNVQTNQPVLNTNLQNIADTMTPMPGQTPAPQATAPAAPAPAATPPAPAATPPVPAATPPAPVGDVAVTNRINRQGEPLSPPLSGKADARYAQMRAAGKMSPAERFTEKTDAMYEGLGDAPAEPGLLERIQGVAPAQQTPDESLQSMYDKIEGMPTPPSEPMSVGSANQALMPGALDTSQKYGYQQAGEPQNRQPQQFVQHGGVNTSVPPNYADMIEAARPTAQLTPINRLEPKTQKDFTDEDPIHGYRKYQEMMRNIGRDPYEVRNSFVDMIFNEFGDLFHKADPHEVGSIVMGLYLDKMVR